MILTVWLTGDESNDRTQDSDHAINNSHDYTSDGVDDCHDTVANGLETGNDGAHVCDWCGWMWIVLMCLICNELLGCIPSNEVVGACFGE